MIERLLPNEEPDSPCGVLGNQGLTLIDHPFSAPHDALPGGLTRSLSIPQASYSVPGRLYTSLWALMTKRPAGEPVGSAPARGLWAVKLAAPKPDRKNALRKMVA